MLDFNPKSQETETGAPRGKVMSPVKDWLDKQSREPSQKTPLTLGLHMLMCAMHLLIGVGSHAFEGMY